VKPPEISEPFTNLLTQGMVLAESYYTDASGRREWVNPADVTVERDAKGNIISAKRTADGVPVIYDGIGTMSKSKNNGVDPQALIDKYAALAKDKAEGDGTARDKARFPLLGAYDLCLKCSHLFNILDARGAISVTERVGVIARVRALAVGIAKAWVDQQRSDAASSESDERAPAEGVRQAPNGRRGSGRPRHGSRSARHPAREGSGRRAGPRRRGEREGSVRAPRSDRGAPRCRQGSSTCGARGMRVAIDGTVASIKPLGPRHAPAYLLINGVWEDHRMYALTADEWRGKQTQK